MKKTIIFVVTFIVGFLAVGLVYAQDAVAGSGNNAASALAIASGLGIAIAAFGGALAQGKAAAATLEGIARNPVAVSKLLTPMIIALALIESLVIYALVIAFLLLGKI